MLTWEKDPFLGVQPIVEKLSVAQPDTAMRHNSDPFQNLPFQKVQHRVDTKDAQPSNETGGISVLVTGALMVSSNGDQKYLVWQD